MDNNTLQKIKDILVKSNNIGIAVGASPSVDAMAGALSLFLLLKAANKQVSIASPTPPIVELSSLVGINRVQNSLGGDAGDLVVSFPYVEGEIEKVSYTLEEGFLNIIVKASEQGLSFDEKDVRYVRGSGAIDLLLVVGTPRLSELEDLVDSQKLRDVRIINIDNKEANQGFGDVVLVSSKFSSVSEQVADLALALGFRLEQDVAQNLLTGITTETKNFQTPNVTPLTFEMMALLMKSGAARRNIESRSPLSLSDDEVDDQVSRLAPRDQQPKQSDDRSSRQEDRRQPNAPRQDDRRPSEDARQNSSRQQLDRRLQEERRAQDDRRPREDQSRSDRDQRPQQAQSDRRPQQQDNRDQRQANAPRQDDRRPHSASSGQAREDQRPQEDRRQSNDNRSDFARDEQRRQDNSKQVQQNQNQDDNASANDDEPPLDWLTPKVYKGSSDVE
jgi:hypothetical protein